ncbi:MAG: TIR domain-containing protein [Propionibacteriaceae bacterium]|jgi:hypothetical protein|nr:TIR domain-containing protein [Propionibacteriaceae bacterium]
MAELFVSYSRADQAEVRPFVTALRGLGHSVWLDQADISTSVRWRDEIAQAVRAAPVFLTVDSASSRSSAACAEERAIAVGLDKNLLNVDKDRLLQSVDVVGGELAKVTAAESARARALGDSFRWHLAGRPRRGFPRGALLKRLGRAARDVTDSVTHEYLGRARRAALLRRLRNGLAATLTIVLIGAWQVAGHLDDEIADRVAERETALGQVGDVIDAAEADVYAGLGLAVRAAGDTGSDYVKESVLAEALAWNSPASVSGAAAGLGPAEPLSAGTEVESGGRVARYAGTGKGVEVRGSSVLTLATTGEVTAMAWSPSGDRFAIADARGVQLYSASTGALIERLRGLDGQIAQIEWRSEDSVEGRAASGATVTWELGAPQTIVDTREKVLAAAIEPDGAAALLVEDAVLVLAPNGEERRTALPKPFSRGFVARGPDGWYAALNMGDDAVALAIDDSGRVSKHAVTGCFALGVAPGASASEILVPCLDYSLAVVDLAQATTRFIHLDLQPRSALAHADGSITVGSVLQEIVRVSPDGRADLNGSWGSSCEGGAAVLAPDPSGRRFAVGGAGADTTCPQIRTLQPDTADPDTINRPVLREGIRRITCAAWSADGRYLAFGFTSGHLLVFDSELYVLRELANPSGDQVLAVAWAPDGRSALLVTGAGQVLRQELPLAALTLDELASVAEARLAVGQEAGLA